MKSSRTVLRAALILGVLSPLFVIRLFGDVVFTSRGEKPNPNKVLVLSTSPNRSGGEDKSADPEVAAKTAYDKLGFSAGVAAIYMFKDNAVEDATVDAGNVVRVNKVSRARTPAILQAYYPIANDLFQGAIAGQLANRNIKTEQALVTDPKPVMGIQAMLEMGGKDAIRSFGVGLLWSWRKYEVDSALRIKVVPPAFNLGFAVLMEPNVKTLASGIVANKPLPAGDAIRYETKPGFGGALTFSAGF